MSRIRPRQIKPASWASIAQLFTPIQWDITDFFCQTARAPTQSRYELRLPDSEKALTALKAGDVATACALFDQAVDTETDPPCLLQAALCYRSANRLNDALSVLKKLDDMGQTHPRCYCGQRYFVPLIDTIRRYLSTASSQRSTIKE